jgi:uncharacterized protein YciI
MLWIVSRVYKPLPPAERAARQDPQRQAHRDYLHSRPEAVILAGPTVTDDGKETTGSQILVNMGSREEVETFIKGDPFVKADIFASITISRLRPGYWNPEAAKGAVDAH